MADCGGPPINLPPEECRSTEGLSSTIVVPELQIWSHEFIINSVVNKYEVPYPPVTPDDCTQHPGSFISMLFNDEYDLDYYKYLYSEVEDRYEWPYIIKTRLLIYPRSAKYMTIDDNGDNLFLLQNHDLILLDALLAYRMDATAMIVIDDATTPVTFIYDSTAGGSAILIASMNTLETELSKLIFVFLDLMVNGNTSNYNDTIPISTTCPVQTIYELYVIDKYFEVVSARGTGITIYCPVQDQPGGTP